MCFYIENNCLKSIKFMFKNYPFSDEDYELFYNYSTTTNSKKCIRYLSKIVPKHVIYENFLNYGLHNPNYSMITFIILNIFDWETSLPLLNITLEFNLSDDLREFIEFYIDKY